MRKFIAFLFFFLLLQAQAQVKILTWNLENYGQSKSDSAIAFIANTLKAYDVVAVQEVVAGNGGAQAIAKLALELNTKGSKWDYVVSDPTSSSAYKTERYAFLWNTAVVKKIGAPWLEQKYSLQIEREPYFCTFEYQLKQFTIGSFHAITKSKLPETEIKYFKLLPAEYPKLNLLFMGDFNCPQSHSVFAPLRNMGFQSALKNQKTSLKKACKNNNCLASEFDNVWYNTKKVKVLRSAVLHFYNSFATLKAAKSVSDHIPVVVELSFN